MKPKVATARALSAYLTRQALTFATRLFIIIVLVLLLLIGLLAYNFTAWWWLLALPLVVLGLLYLLLYWVIRRLTSLIYRHPYSGAQRQALDGFTDKVRGLLDAKSTPLPIFVLITLKDVLLHKDPRTIRKLIDDSTHLKSDLRDLEKHFGER